MKRDEIVEELGVTPMTLHRYLKRHPKLDVKDANSLEGHPFPQPVSKNGREFEWDRDEVEKWIRCNEQYIGRRAPKKPIIRIPYVDWRVAVAKISEKSKYSDRTAETSDTDTVSRKIIADELDEVLRVERSDDFVRVLFSSMSAAVHFKLKYAFTNEDRNVREFPHED